MIGAAFESTRWSIVLAAGTSKTPASTRALSILCETYWAPIYAYIRRRGYGVEDAEDLTQGLFAHLLEKKGFDSVSRDRGKFRTFLLASMKNFAANEWRKGQTRKRGSGARGVPVDFMNAERRLSTEPDGSSQTPESLFEKHWALALLSRVLDELRRDYEKAGYEEIFNSLKACLAVSEVRRPHRELADELGIFVGAVKVAIHRMRKRYRQRLLDEIAQTVGPDEDIQEELQYIFRVLGD